MVTIMFLRKVQFWDGVWKDQYVSVLRWRLKNTVSVIRWSSSGRLFHAAGPAERKPRSPNLFLAHGFSNICMSRLRQQRRGVAGTLSYSYSYRVTLFNISSQRSHADSFPTSLQHCLSEKVSFQLRSELLATDVRWAEVRWKCVPNERSRNVETKDLIRNKICSFPV